MARFICIALLAIFAFIPVVQADDNANHRELLSKHYKLQKPVGAGPYPAVLMVPGCAGFDAKFVKKHYDKVQSQLVELGFVTLRVNYLAVRNATICYPDVPTSNVADDICIATEYLRQQTYVKKGAINVIGWSWGGASAFRVLRPEVRLTGIREPANVDAVVAYYPHCNAAREWDSEVPVLVLGGAIDNISPFSACEMLFSQVAKRDRLTIRVYDDAHHGFDRSELPAEMQSRFGTIGYNEAAAKSAWIEVTNFLRK